MKQTVVKQVLTEGEKFVMSIFTIVKFADQGVYDVVNNLSSLAARFLFAPIEETSYQMFCKYIDRQKEASDQEAGCLHQAQQLLCTLVRGVTLLGAMIFVFGFNFAQLSLLIYAGRGFATGTTAFILMRWQCLYILIIAVNGVTESFAMACMSQRRLDTFNWFLVLLSISLTTSSVFLIRLFSSLGFIIANCFNMLIRILHSIHFIRQYLKQSSTASGFSIKSLFPEPILIFALIPVFILLRASEERLCCQSLSDTLLHIGLGCCLFLSYLYLIYCREKQLVQYVEQTLFSKSGKILEKRD